MVNKILCIDDDPITLLLYKKIITKLEFSKTIDVVTNGDKAIEYFREILNQAENKNKLIDIIPKYTLLDLNMPIMNGWEFLDQISTLTFKILHPFLKIIIVSSSIDPIDILRSKDYPVVVKFLSKPLTQEKLQSIVK